MSADMFNLDHYASINPQILQFWLLIFKKQSSWSITLIDEMKIFHTAICVTLIAPHGSLVIFNRCSGVSGYIMLTSIPHILFDCFSINIRPSITFS